MKIKDNAVSGPSLMASVALVWIDVSEITSKASGEVVSITSTSVVVELDSTQESSNTAQYFAEEIGKSSGGFFVATVGVNGTTVTIEAA